MSKETTIAWCHHSFNPFWGCSHVSPGCVNCYAETWAKRLGEDVWGAKGERRTFPEKHWREPLAWNAAAQRAGERRRVFCASMADVFEDHPALPPERAKLWTLIEATPNLDWLLLTKRIENVSGMVPWGPQWPPSVWLGTSVESQRWAEERIPDLVTSAARVKFVSVEPLLEPVDLSYWLRVEWAETAECWGQEMLAAAAGRRPELNWVIVGGESGHGARRMDPEWARTLRDQCGAAWVPFLFKQTGTVLAREWGLKEAKGEDMAEWPADLQVRQWPDPLGIGQEVLL